jgi:ABC-type Fe3+ transport system permease subunit
MTDPIATPNAGDETSGGAGLGPNHRMPRWLKVSGIIVAAAAVLLVVLMLTGVLGGGHGPEQFGPGGH